jgi:hypothetical protein
LSLLEQEMLSKIRNATKLAQSEIAVRIDDFDEMKQALQRATGSFLGAERVAMCGFAAT